jgi:nitrogen-specific signal transduction histidine kinase
VSFDSAWFYTFDSKENCLFLAETKGTYTKPNEIFLNKIKENNLIFDLYADSEMEILTAQDKRPRLYHKDNFKSCMTIPIKSNTMLAGVLTLATEKQFAFKNEDLMALQLIADQVAEMNTLRETLINLKSSTDIILDSINAGLITIDMDGNLDYANTMARNYIHEISDRHIGKAADMIIKKTPFNNLLFNSLKSRQFINNKKIDFFHETKKLCFSVSTFPLKSGSFEEPTGIALFFKDITQEEFLKAELKRNESLSALGEMAAGVAHEIRNPLSGIKMVMQVLQSEFNIMDPRQEHINIVLDEVDRLAKIITDLMAFAKPRMLVLKNENIFTALKSALRMLAPEIKAKNIQIELYHDNQIILHDSERMVQVFLNVIKNAVDASFINSKIIVKIFYEINADTAKYLIIKIENSGNPIKNDEIEKIFNPFYTTKDSGTGLGLPITHSIIKEHKGKIHVKSTPQGDTEFKILIPLDINLNS